MFNGKPMMPVQTGNVAIMPKRHPEPDADQNGGPSDKDADDKGFMKLRYRKGGKRKFKK